MEILLKRRDLIKALLSMPAPAGWCRLEAVEYKENLIDNKGANQKYFVTPRDFGAIGGANGYSESNDERDDTLAVQAAISSGVDSVILDDHYVIRSLKICRPINMVGGTLIKKRGADGKLLTIESSGVHVKNLSIICFNASFVGEIRGEVLLVYVLISGTIVVESQTGGPMISSPGMIPGTKIMEKLNSQVGSCYRVNQAQRITRGIFKFTDANVFNHENDCVLNKCDDVKLEGLKIDGSPGGGVTSIGGQRLIVDGFSISNVSDNGILIACTNETCKTDQNVILNGAIKGTGRQNGIFVTASAGSEKTLNSIRGIRIENITSSYVADSALEIGMHVYDAAVSQCRLGPSYNPPLLCRDAVGFKISDIEIIGSDDFRTSEYWSAVAVIKQEESDKWECHGVFSRVRFVGSSPRGFLFVNQSYIAVEDCYAEYQSEKSGVNGNAFSTNFIVIGDSIRNLSIRNTVANGWGVGLLLNYSGELNDLQNILLEKNLFLDIGIIIDAGNAHVNKILLRDNKMRGCKQLIVNGQNANIEQGFAK